jgi:hypothetical protein
MEEITTNSLVTMGTIIMMIEVTKLKRATRVIPAANDSGILRPLTAIFCKSFTIGDPIIDNTSAKKK